MELKRLGEVRSTDLGRIATTACARHWLEITNGGPRWIERFDDLLNDYMQAVAPYCDPWICYETAFEKLAEDIDDGAVVLILDETPLFYNRVFDQKADKWEVVDNHFLDRQVTQRFSNHLKIVQEQAREEESYRENHPPVHGGPATETVELAIHRTTLGLHQGAERNGLPVDNSKLKQEGEPPPENSRGFPINDKQAEATFRQALADQKVMLESKRTELDTWDANAQANFKKWFGSTNENDRTTIKNRIDKTLELNKNYDITKFQPSSPKNRDAYAYVNPSDAEKRIYLGDPFWSAAPTGVDSKAGILSHEMSHFDGVGGTDDFAYGADDAKRLAKDDPSKALYNADNFEFYLEDAK